MTDVQRVAEVVRHLTGLVVYREEAVLLADIEVLEAVISGPEDEPPATEEPAATEKDDSTSGGWTQPAVPPTTRQF